MISFKSILASFYNFDQLQADDSVDEEVLNHYCWMYSTFDIPEDFMVSQSEQIQKQTVHNTNLYLYKY